jgi:hypothetical protein
MASGVNLAMNTGYFSMRNLVRICRFDWLMIGSELSVCVHPKF